MTEQPPSASSEWESTPEAKEAAYELRCRLGHNQRSNFDADRIIAYALDRFAERVSERWQNRDRQRLEQISTLQETVQSFQNARDERPAIEREALRRIAEKAPDTRLSYTAKELDDFFTAALSERQTAAIRAFGQRVWSDTEEVAYQAGVKDALERLK